MKREGHKILITGATSGIGEALTCTFSQWDNQIIALGRNATRLRELQESHKNIIPFQCDLAMPTEVNRLVDFIKQEHSDLNILINNAGIQYNCNLMDEMYTLENLDDEIMINLIVPMKLTKQLLPLLQENSNPTIVNISSGLGIVPKTKSAVYCATKAGIHIFSKSLRYQLKNFNVFEIIPSLVDTEMTKGRGKGKISPQELVDEFLSAFEKNRYEVNIGKVKLLRMINRVSPKLADRIMKGN